MLHLHWDWKRILHLYMQSQHSLNWQQMLALNCACGRFTVSPDGQMIRFDPHITDLTYDSGEEEATEVYIPTEGCMNISVASSSPLP